MFCYVNHNWLTSLLQFHFQAIPSPCLLDIWEVVLGLPGEKCPCCYPIMYCWKNQVYISFWTIPRIPTASVACFNVINAFLLNVHLKQLKEAVKSGINVLLQLPAWRQHTDCQGPSVHSCVPGKGQGWEWLLQTASSAGCPQSKMVKLILM